MRDLECLSVVIKLYSLGTGEPKMAVEWQNDLSPAWKIKAR